MSIIRNQEFKRPVGRHGLMDKAASITIFATAPSDRRANRVWRKKAPSMIISRHPSIQRVNSTQIFTLHLFQLLCRWSDGKRRKRVVSWTGLCCQLCLIYVDGIKQMYRMMVLIKEIKTVKKETAHYGLSTLKKSKNLI